jgi:hypothetical protein
MGAKCSDPPSDFFAKVIMTRVIVAIVKSSRAAEGLDWDTRRGRCRRGRRIDRRPFKPGTCKAGIPKPGIFKPGFRFRRLSADGLRKRHGLRDQKITLLPPFHDAPQPESHLSKKPAINQAAVRECPTKNARWQWISYCADPVARFRI